MKKRKKRSMSRATGVSIPLNEPCQDSFKASLEEYAVSLERYQAPLKDMPQKASEWLDSAKKTMKETTELIHKNFKMIRDAINKKEEEVLKCLEKSKADQDATKELISNARDLRRDIPGLLESVRTLLTKWDTKKPTTKDVLAIKEKVERGANIIGKLSEFNNCNTHVTSSGFLQDVKRDLEGINNIRTVSLKRLLYYPPTGLKVKKVSSVVVSLAWNESEEFTEYAVMKREKGCLWDENDDNITYVDTNMNKCYVYPLKPDRKYEFCLMGKNVCGLETMWSGPVLAETKVRTIFPEVYNKILSLKDSMGNTTNCTIALENISKLLKVGKHQELLPSFKNAKNTHSILQTRTGQHSGKQEASSWCLTQLKSTGTVMICANGDTVSSVTSQTMVNNICASHKFVHKQLSEDNQAIAGKCGTTEILVDTLERSLGNIKMCFDVCKVLYNISGNSCKLYF